MPRLEVIIAYHYVNLTYQPSSKYTLKLTVDYTIEPACHKTRFKASATIVRQRGRGRLLPVASCPNFAWDVPALLEEGTGR
jgi:hypothetical protein